ncbi:alpha/beta fold hydrolase [Paenibacillus sp. 1P07SE]|uniref:alpha/beta fold hydrolase n=1 Tax=Paenibacillus sp. 1P07SE TaxID=3132209 RepID=UPI0039A5BFCF
MDYNVFKLGDVTLQSGAILPDAFLAYKTYGTLNADKSNVILYPTAFGDQHRDNEWLIGEGMALDPEHYFIIVPNLLGNGLSSSPSNTPAPYDRDNFPQVTISDNVRFQHRLLTARYGITKLALVTGWSLGAVQVYAWAAGYPDMVERIAPFAGTAKVWPHTHVFLEGVKAPLHAVLRTGGLEGERATTALRAVGRVYAGWGFSQSFYRESGYTQWGSETMEAFLTDFWERSFTAHDPYNLLAMLWTGQHADISDNATYNGDFELALRSITAQAVVMPGSTDLYFTAEDIEYEASLIPHAVCRPIASVWGHLAGRGLNPEDNRFIDEQLGQLLAASV